MGHPEFGSGSGQDVTIPLPVQFDVWHKPMQQLGISIGHDPHWSSGMHVPFQFFMPASQQQLGEGSKSDAWQLTLSIKTCQNPAGKGSLASNAIVVLDEEAVNVINFSSQSSALAGLTVT